MEGKETPSLWLLLKILTGNFDVEEEGIIKVIIIHYHHHHSSSLSSNSGFVSSDDVSESEGKIDSESLILRRDHA